MPRRESCNYCERRAGWNAKATGTWPKASGEWRRSPFRLAVGRRSRTSNVLTTEKYLPPGALAPPFSRAAPLFFGGLGGAPRGSNRRRSGTDCWADSARTLRGVRRTFGDGRRGPHGGLAGLGAMSLEIKEFHDDRKTHRKVDVSLRDVKTRPFGDEAHSDQK